MKWSSLFFIIVPPIAFAYLLAVFAPRHWSAAAIASLLLTVAGLALLTLARIQLGNSFSLTPQARQLVTRGLYSRIRHPVYVFGSLAAAGLFLYLNKPKWLLLLVIILPMQVLRARAEERVLEHRFGDEYRTYRASTWF